MSLLNKIIKYRIYIKWNNKNNTFVAEIPDLPRCLANGKTYKEALANGKLAIDEWVKIAKKLGHTIPKPKEQIYGIRFYILDILKRFPLCLLISILLYFPLGFIIHLFTGISNLYSWFILFLYVGIPLSVVISILSEIHSRHNLDVNKLKCPNCKRKHSAFWLGTESRGVEIISHQAENFMGPIGPRYYEEKRHYRTYYICKHCEYRWSIDN